LRSPLTHTDHKRHFFGTPAFAVECVAHIRAVLSLVPHGLVSEEEHARIMDRYTGEPDCMEQLKKIRIRNRCAHEKTGLGKIR
jgi:hypothetical protein